MIDARLPLALGEGGPLLPSGGRVAVFRPPVDASLSALEGFQVEIVEGFRPAFDAWTTRGMACAVEPEGVYDASVVCLPRARAEAHAMIADAVRMTKGPVLIDGQKTDGADSILRAARRRTEVTGPFIRAHGKLFVMPDADPGDFADWQAGPALTEGGFWTAPGVFSADAVDPASALLAQALPERLGRTVVDLGAGWGFLSAHVLTRDTVEQVHLVEAGHMALECARHNVTDPRAAFYWADATRWQAPGPCDTVVMNPPFHTGRDADPALGQAFVASAARLLASNGHLWMVANRHLPYEATLQKFFSKVTEVGGDNRFKLFQATRPLRRRR